MALDRGGPSAVVDIGTNTAVLYVPADPRRGNPSIEIERFVRLGEELSATGKIGSAALVRLRSALDTFQVELAEHRVSALRVIGTSACRDAENVDDVAAVVRSALGVDLDVISGQEEAALSFLAAKYALGTNLTKAAGRLAVVDIGGGSTEVVCGPFAPTSAGPDESVSLDVGSVRCTERFVSDPGRPISDEVLRVVQSHVRASLRGIDAALKRAVGESRQLVFVDGIASVLKALCTSGPDHPASGFVVTLSSLDALNKRVSALTEAELVQLAPNQLRGRADVFPVAMVILLEVMRWAGSDACALAETSIRHGAICQMVGRASDA